MRSATGARTLQFGLLGPVQVSVRGEAHAVTLSSLKRRAVLAMLVLQLNEIVAFDALLDGLWGPRPPASAASTMRSYLSRLRQALAVDASVRLCARAPGYVLEANPDQVDVHRFEQLVRRGHADAGRDATAAVAAYVAALALWRGPALADLSDWDFARPAASRLEALRLETVEALGGAYLDAGIPERAVTVLEPLLAEQPFRERSTELLMLGLYRCGRQADALRAYRRLRRDLVGQLGVEPTPALRELERRILLQHPTIDPAKPHPAADHTPGPPPTAAPLTFPIPMSRFIGRTSECRRVAAMLGPSRLVTLTGAGGVGKTRLGLAVAAARCQSFPGGLWFLDLAPLTNPELLIGRLAAALELAPGVGHASAASLLDQVVRHLAERRALLVIDNCEHLRTAVASVVDTLLRGCPELTVLATSRERIGIGAETTWRVPSLGLPRGTATPAELLDSDAGALLCDRAATADEGFRVHAGNAAALSGLCRRLDGIPLALELAAANLAGSTLADVPAALDARLAGAAGAGGGQAGPARHETLRACMDWGHDLLGVQDQALLRSLSVFAGTFDLEAAEVIGPGSLIGAAEILGRLSRLVETSWVAVEAGGDGIRFRLVETVRRYAAERLDVATETASTGRTHRDHFLLVASGYAGPPMCATRWWLTRVSADYANIHAALEWSWLAGDVETCLRLSGSLFPYWILDGRILEGRHWLERVLHAAPATPRPARTWALVALGLVLVYSGEPAPGMALWHEARDAAAEADPLGAAYATGYLGNLEMRWQPRAGEELVRQAREQFVDLGRPIGAAWCDFSLGWAALAKGEHGAAAQVFEAALAVGESEGSDVLIAHVLGALASLRALVGDRAAALTHAADAVAAARRIGLRRVLVMALARAAEATALAGETARAAPLVIETLRTIRELGEHMWVDDMLQITALIKAASGATPVAVTLLAAGTASVLADGGHRPLHEAAGACRARLEGELDPAVLAAAWARGRALSTADAIGVALTALADHTDRFSIERS